MELDILEIRLNELKDVVDKFVLVEATKTHSGLDKPLYYLQNRSRFLEFFDKIIHIVVHDMPMTSEEIQSAISPQDRKWLDTGYQMGDNWVRERFQRNAIMRGLVDCSPDDIIIIEDADEMLYPDIIAKLDGTMCEGSNAVEQEFRTCYANWKCVNMPWYGSKVLQYKYVTNPSEHRFHTPASCYINKGGLHMNFWGGAEAIQTKIKSYAHQEFNIPAVLDNVGTQLENRKDVLGRLYEYKVVPLDDTLPKYFMNNLDKFDKYIYKE
jgi:beta-1,4-mannosyl-glycoprotein beta-1,4-N-acetylglucosaminyltransferase